MDWRRCGLGRGMAGSEAGFPIRSERGEKAQTRSDGKTNRAQAARHDHSLSERKHVDLHMGHAAGAASRGARVRHRQSSLSTTSY